MLWGSVGNSDGWQPVLLMRILRYDRYTVDYREQKTECDVCGLVWGKKKTGLKEEKKRIEQVAKFIVPGWGNKVNLRLKEEKEKKEPVAKFIVPDWWK